MEPGLGAGEGMWEHRDGDKRVCHLVRGAAEALEIPPAALCSPSLPQVSRRSR